MSTQTQNTNHLRELKMLAMAQSYELQNDQPKLHDLAFDERFGMLLDSELTARKNRKLNRLVKAANFPEMAALEDLDMKAGRGLDKSQVAGLAKCSWIARQQNVLVLGPTGVGKTWLGCAFGQRVCRQNISVEFHRVSDLYTEIIERQVDGSLSKFKAELFKPALLILDDFGIGEMTPFVAQVLLDVVDRRSRTGSLLVTSQYPVDKWHDFFPDATIADAVLDRIVHHAHRVHLKGESMRKLRGKASLAEE